MKFGKRLAQEAVEEWREHYVDYKGLKMLIKAEEEQIQQQQQQQSEQGQELEQEQGQDKSLFEKELERQVQRVDEFVHGELRRSSKGLAEAEAQLEGGVTPGAVQAFAHVCEAVERLRAFVVLNHLAVTKIAKKHAKRCHSNSHSHNHSHNHNGGEAPADRDASRGASKDWLDWVWARWHPLAKAQPLTNLLAHTHRVAARLLPAPYVDRHSACARCAQPQPLPQPQPQPQPFVVLACAHRLCPPCLHRLSTHAHAKAKPHIRCPDCLARHALTDLPPSPPSPPHDTHSHAHSQSRSQSPSPSQLQTPSPSLSATLSDILLSASFSATTTTATTTATATASSLTRGLASSAPRNIDHGLFPHLPPPPHSPSHPAHLHDPSFDAPDVPCLSCSLSESWSLSSVIHTHDSHINLTSESSYVALSPSRDAATTYDVPTSGLASHPLSATHGHSSWTSLRPISTSTPSSTSMSASTTANTASANTPASTPTSMLTPTPTPTPISTPTSASASISTSTSMSTSGSGSTSAPTPSASSEATPAAKKVLWIHVSGCDPDLCCFAPPSASVGNTITPTLGALLSESAYSLSLASKRLPAHKPTRRTGPGPGSVAQPNPAQDVRGLQGVRGREASWFATLTGVWPDNALVPSRNLLKKHPPIFSRLRSARRSAAVYLRSDQNELRRWAQQSASSVLQFSSDALTVNAVTASLRPQTMPPSPSEQMYTTTHFEPPTTSVTQPLSINSPGASHRPLQNRRHSHGHKHNHNHNQQRRSSNAHSQNQAKRTPTSNPSNSVPDLTYVHLANPLTKGSDVETRIRAVTEADRHLGQLVDALKDRQADPKLAATEDWMLVVTLMHEEPAGACDLSMALRWLIQSLPPDTHDSSAPGAASQSQSAATQASDAKMTPSGILLISTPVLERGPLSRSPTFVDIVPTILKHIDIPTENSPSLDGVMLHPHRPAADQDDEDEEDDEYEYDEEQGEPGNGHDVLGIKQTDKKENDQFGTIEQPGIANHFGIDIQQNGISIATNPKATASPSTTNSNSIRIGGSFGQPAQLAAKSPSGNQLSYGSVTNGHLVQPGSSFKNTTPSPSSRFISSSIGIAHTPGLGPVGSIGSQGILGTAHPTCSQASEKIPQPSSSSHCANRRWSTAAINRELMKDEEVFEIEL